MRGFAILMIAAGLGAAAGQAAAQSANADRTGAPAPRASPCLGVPGGESCMPIYACVEPLAREAADPAVVVVGRAVGKRRGEIALELSSGSRCSGRWSNPAIDGALHARCDDGRRFSLVFQHRDPVTGTLFGNGNTNRGEHVFGWMGEKVDLYLAAQAGVEVGEVPCGFDAVRPTS